MVATDELRAARTGFDGEDVLDRFDIKVHVEVRQIIYPGRDVAVRVPVQTDPFEWNLRIPSGHAR